MRISVSFVIAVALSAPRPAQAGPLYGVTDLGQNYSLQSALDGNIHGVTNSDGSATYAFDKSQVEAINQRVDGGAHASSYTEWTLTNGTTKIGYSYDYSGVLSNGPILYPTIDRPYPSNAPLPSFPGWNSGWRVMAGAESPVSDFNTQGQMVGTSLYDYQNQGLGTFAAFTAPNFLSHDNPFLTSAADNLNSVIAPIAGISLTAALRIDDDGRILTRGSNGDVYLLTPTALGAATPIPEPAPVMLFGLIVGALGLRARRSGEGQKKGPGT